MTPPPVGSPQKHTFCPFTMGLFLSCSHHPVWRMSPHSSALRRPSYFFLSQFMVPILEPNNLTLACQANNPAWQCLMFHIIYCLTWKIKRVMNVALECKWSGWGRDELLYSLSEKELRDAHRRALVVSSATGCLNIITWNNTSLQLTCGQWGPPAANVYRTVKGQRNKPDLFPLACCVNMRHSKAWELIRKKSRNIKSVSKERGKLAKGNKSPLSVSSLL